MSDKSDAIRHAPAVPAQPAITIQASAAHVAEEELRRGIIHTQIEPRLARGLCVVFAAVLCAVPVSQCILELSRRQRPQVLEVFSHAPSKQNFKRIEEDLARASWLRSAAEPRVQAGLCALGFGNSKAVIGREGWLFYEPGVTFVGGPGILAGRRLHPPRGKLTDDDTRGERHPDPRPAIVEFSRQCRDAGIHLIVLPVPDKAMLEPARLSVRLAGTREPLLNPDYARLLDELRREGVDVFDIVPREITADLFLSGDTHWTPEWMRSAAADLAHYVQARKLIAASTQTEWRLEPYRISNYGDLVAMLKLAPGQTQFKKQTVSLERVVDEQHLPWQPAPDAEILVLGDSFCNIYSLESMGWGDASGFVEQLGVQLRAPVDRLVRNDAGAYATRELLSRELARGRNRLAGKKVLVWEFAMRELTAGDWKSLPLILTPAAAQKFFVPERNQSQILSGTVAAVAPCPRPGSVPYKDHIIALHLVDIKDPAEAQAVVYLWSMRDNVLTPAARLREGDKLTLRVSPWSDVEKKFGAINRAELPDADLLDQAPCWGEEVRE